MGKEWCHIWRQLMDTSGDSRKVNSQSYPLSIKLTVFFNQITDNGLWVSLKPAGQGDDQKLEGMFDVRHCLKRLPTTVFDNSMKRFNQVFAPHKLIDQCFSIFR